MASVTRLVGDLATAEDAVQDACLAAVQQWPVQGVPANPRAWLISVARHKALDAVRRDARRGRRELVAAREAPTDGAVGPGTADTDPPTGSVGTGAGTAADELALIFMCCHPALEPSVRVALTLRAVCGLATAEIAAVFLVPEATMAKRLTRAKRKIRDAGIALRMPEPPALAERLDAVLRVVYLVFTEGHKASAGDTLVRADLCDRAVELARCLRTLLPDEPEVAGLLALLLLTDARRAARVDPNGDLVLLEEQDRRLWRRDAIAEGEALLEAALRAGRPGPYQLHAAIAACHSTAARADDTDWRQIALLYAELLRHEPSPVVEANRAVAVAMAGDLDAGLRILDSLGGQERLRRWPALHLARADLLRRAGRHAEAAQAYRAARGLGLTPAEQRFVERRLGRLGS